MTRILLTAPFSENHVNSFAEFDGCEFVFDADPSRERLESVDVIFGNPSASSLKDLKELKWVQAASAGVNPYIDQPEIFKNGMTLTCLSGAFGQSISEFVLTMVLMLYKNMHRYRDNQNACLWKDEGWQESPVGKKLLILGAGDIGTEIARRFRPFGCHITGMRRTVREIPEEFDAMITMEGLDEALKEADIIACALPETKETIKLLDRERLMLLKSTALLVNVGRGTLIDCEALADILAQGRIKGAALDVTDPEPLPTDHPLWKQKNAIVTPHTTGGSFGHLKATENRLFEICKTNLERYLKGEALLNEVDPATGYRKTENRFS